MSDDDFKFHTFNVEFLNDSSVACEAQFDVCERFPYDENGNLKSETGCDLPHMMAQILYHWEVFRKENHIQYPQILTVTEVFDPEGGWPC